MTNDDITRITKSLQSSVDAVMHSIERDLESKIERIVKHYVREEIGLHVDAALRKRVEERVNDMVIVEVKLT